MFVRSPFILDPSYLVSSQWRDDKKTWPGGKSLNGTYFGGNPCPSKKKKNYTLQYKTCTTRLKCRKQNVLFRFSFSVFTLVFFNSTR